MNRTKKNQTSSSFIRRKKEKIHIQVGLDFGTSSTKVVFSQLGRPLFRALDFNHNLPQYPNYCIPSVCAVGENGRILMGANAARALANKEWNAGLQRLKVVVAGKHDTRFSDIQTDITFKSYLANHDTKTSPEMLTVKFLAHVMIKSIQAIKNFPEYKNQDIDFAFNICMPIDHVEHSQVRKVFERIFVLSEMLLNNWLKNPEKINFSIDSKMIEDSKNRKADKVFAVPESVASFASYLTSLRRREGLHALIDFGAGTTDVSICNLFLSQEDPIHYWYSARNIPRGTVNVERRIADHIHTFDKKKDTCTFQDIVSCLEDLSNHKDGRHSGYRGDQLNRIITEELINLRDSREYKTTWGNAYGHLKKDYLWRHVEIYTCGGGSYLPEIDKIFSKPWWKNLHVSYPVRTLPIPDDYDPGTAEAPFERMSVAYGLAIPLPELDKHTLPQSSPNHTPAPPPVHSLDHEDLYSD